MRNKILLISTDSYGYVVIGYNGREYIYPGVPEWELKKIKRKCARNDKSVFADLSKYANRERVMP